MSTIAPLSPADFPVAAIGQFVYRRTSSSPFIGPVSMDLAVDLAGRLNREHQVAQALERATAAGEPLVVSP